MSNELLDAAEGWVFSSERLSNYDAPDEGLYYFLVDSLGGIIEILNITNDWGYPISEDMADRLNRVWRGIEGVSPLRPRYTPIATRAHSMSEDDYMWMFMKRYILPMYIDLERNRNRSYVTPMGAIFGSDTLNPIRTKWRAYLDTLPGDTSDYDSQLG